jgi:Uma2 family endonuclease
VRVGVLVDGTYNFQNFTGKQVIQSAIFPDLKLTAAQMLGTDK